MKTTLTALILLISISTMAQTTYTVTNDTQIHQKVFNGKVTFEDLNKEKSFKWLKKGWRDYEPDQNDVAYLTTRLSKYDIVVFLGTWCGDSHDLIPKFEKVLDQANYPMHKLTMYAVDMEKKTTNGENEKYNITRVPTFILYRNGTEIGRITESVKSSIERDLAGILDKDEAKAFKN